MPKTYQVSISEKVCGWFEAKDRMDIFARHVIDVLASKGFALREVGPISLEELPHRKEDAPLMSVKSLAALQNISRQTGCNVADILDRILDRLDTGPLGLRALFPEKFATWKTHGGFGSDRMKLAPVPEPRIRDIDADDGDQADDGKDSGGTVTTEFTVKGLDEAITAIKDLAAAVTATIEPDETIEDVFGIDACSCYRNGLWPTATFKHVDVTLFGVRYHFLATEEDALKLIAAMKTQESVQASLRKLEEEVANARCQVWDPALAGRLRLSVDMGDPTRTKVA